MTGKLYPAGEKVANESLLDLSPDGDDAVDIDDGSPQAISPC